MENIDLQKIISNWQGTSNELQELIRNLEGTAK